MICIFVCGNFEKCALWERNTLAENWFDDATSSISRAWSVSEPWIQLRYLCVIWCCIPHTRLLPFFLGSIETELATQLSRSQSRRCQPFWVAAAFFASSSSNWTTRKLIKSNMIVLCVHMSLVSPFRSLVIFLGRVQCRVWVLSTFEVFCVFVKLCGRWIARNCRHTQATKLWIETQL